ncbi:hypothetical protein BV898_02578 [Hypsibius exemplaris]|uniref:LysM domain-containing protein n=1 Tax=Hypsibius exemplaris TaxID=2072580 RepID=A0A1W0X7F0_HYPEX|nr:hypothetical protein BV898_02578 [Hypsibius exemplaris]
MSTRQRKVDSSRSEENRHTSNLTSLAGLKHGLCVRAPTIVFSVEAAVCLSLLLGTILVLYPSNEPTKARRVSSVEKKTAKPNNFVANQAPKKNKVPEAVQSPPYTLAPDDGPTCTAVVNVGDTCEGIVSGYDITDVARLLAMNPGLPCPPAVGTTLYIRRGQTCGNPCNKDLC